jgi:hypothetical protein
MSRAIQIGWWVVKPGAEPISHCPSYYAADHEALQPLPGLYPARLVFEAGFNIPMPHWLVAGVDCTRISGELYSGFGGVNFAHTTLKPGESKQYVHQCYDYQIPELARAGRLLLAEPYAWMKDAGGPGQPGSIVEVYMKVPPPPAALEAVQPASAEPEEAEVIARPCNGSVIVDARPTDGTGFNAMCDAQEGR